jgi:hypothetical protein
MANDGTIKKEDIIDPSVSPALTSLINQFKELVEGAAAFAATLKTLPIEFTNSIKSISDLKNVAAQNETLTAQTVNVNKKLSESLKEITVESIRAKEAQKQSNDEMKARAIAEDKNAGTLKRAEAQIKLNTLLIKNLDLTQAGAKEKAELWNEEINKNNDLIDKNSDKIKKNRRNVGSYTESIEKAHLNLGEMRKELMALKNISFDGKTKEDIAQINDRMGKLMHQMKESKAEVANLGKNGFELAAGSAKFFAAVTETVIGALDVLGPKLGIGKENIAKLRESVTGLIAVTHGLAEMEEVIKARTLQTTLVRLKDTAVTIYNTTSKWLGFTALQAFIVAKKAETAATIESEGATVGLTAAQWLWNAALFACPIVVITIVIAALTTGVYLLVKALKSGSDSTKVLTEQLDSLKKSAAETEAFNKFAEDLMNAYGMTEVSMVEAKIKHTKERIGLIEAEMAKEMELAKAKHQWTAEQNKEYAEQAKELGNLNGEIILLGIQLKKAKGKENNSGKDNKTKSGKSDTTDVEKLALEEHVRFAEAKRAIDLEKNQQELNDHIKLIEAKRKLDLYDAKTPGEIAKINAEADRQIYDSKKEYADKQKKLADDLEKSQDNDLKELENEQDNALKALEKEQDTDLADLNKELDAEDAIKRKHEEEELKRQRELANTISSIKKKALDDINGYFNLQSEYLKQQETNQLSHSKLTSAEQTEIKRKYAKEQAQIARKQAELNKAISIVEIGVDTAVAVMKAIDEFPGPTGISLGILIGILGAIKEAEVIAMPLPPVPSFKKGGKDVGGHAILHGGELVQLSSGEKFLTLGDINQPIEAILPKHTDIIPNNILRENILKMPKTNNNNEIITQNRLLSEMLKEIKKDKKLVQFNMDAEGFSAYQVSRNEYIKRIGKFRGDA